jgi:hypothetical protein
MRTSILPQTWQTGELRTFAVALGVCMLVGLWVAFQGPGPLTRTALAHNLVSANATGLSIYGIAMLIRVFLRGRLPVWGIVVAIPAGNLLGSRLAGLAGAPDFMAVMLGDPAAMRWAIVSYLLLGAVITAFFLYYSHSKGVRIELESERRRVAEAQHAETLARLSMLQAQIEPHFLFNTLANIHCLIKQDPDTASRILEELNAYLRVSLRRSRQPTSTLGEELELVETLLTIASARLGARLEYTISSPVELQTTPFPPLLLQPLVENAIWHGIEPAIAGGKIQIEVRNRQDALELTVTDTGIGLNADAPQGMGLANIRSRLDSLYGQNGRLELYANVPHGVIAKVIVPIPSA